MTLPEQSDRAVAQTRAFLVRLASPYAEAGIKGIRREVRAEASRLLRHYPYAKSDEKRGVDDMSGATAVSDLVTRLRNWREVHLARLHLLMEEAADEMAMLAGYRDAAESDLTVAIIAAERLRLTDLELAAIGRAVKDENDFGLVYTADVLQSLLDRLSGSGDCPEPDNASNADTLAPEVRRLDDLITARQPTLTDAEREAIESAIWDYQQNDDDKDCARMVCTFEGLLERMA